MLTPFPWLRRPTRGAISKTQKEKGTPMMSSPEKREGPDLQLSFVFGNSDGRPQKPPATPVDADPQEPPVDCSPEMLCLSRTNLKCVGEHIFKNSTLKYLYLEGNQISSIPDLLFISLPNLLWLDLRNNQITSLPAEIGLHRSLKTILLEGNPISALPPELGNVITLKGLSLRFCPITFPPQDIVNQGLQSILQYLRSVMAKRPVSVKTPPPELPVVERLQLSELMGSSVEEQDESVDEAELQRFRELKHKMILLDKAELGLVALGNRTSLVPITKRKKAHTKAGIIPELPLFGTQHLKKTEESRRPAKDELKDKQSVTEQRRRSQEALHKWRTEARIKQEKTISQHKQKGRERQRKREEAETNQKPVEDSGDSPQSQVPGRSITDYVEARSIRELERQIHALVKKMEERRRNPRGTSTEQMAAAEQDVEEMRRLQVRILEKKKYQRRDYESHCTMVTADAWQSFLHN